MAAKSHANNNNNNNNQTTSKITSLRTNYHRVVLNTTAISSSSTITGGNVTSRIVQTSSEIKQSTTASFCGRVARCASGVDDNDEDAATTEIVIAPCTSARTHAITVQPTMMTTTVGGVADDTNDTFGTFRTPSSIDESSTTNIMTRSDCVLDQPEYSVVDADWLADRLEHADSSTDRQLLVLDARSTSDFERMHVIDSVHVTIPGLIYKRLVKGATTPTCVLPINTATASIRQRLQANPHLFDVVVVAPDSLDDDSLAALPSTSAAHHPMSIGRLLVNRFGKFGCNAALLEGSLHSFSARYAHLCATTTTTTTTTTTSTQQQHHHPSSSVVPLPFPHPQHSHHQRPSNLGPLLSLDCLQLDDQVNNNNAAPSTQSMSTCSSGYCSHTSSNQPSFARESCSSAASTSKSSALSTQASFDSNNSNKHHPSSPTTNASCSSSMVVLQQTQCTGTCYNNNNVMIDTASIEKSSSSAIPSQSAHSSQQQQPISNQSPMPSPRGNTAFLADIWDENGDFLYEKCNGAISGFPVRIVDNLYLGNASNSTDRRILDKYNIRYILNVTPNLPNQFIDDNDFHYLQVPVSDHWSQSLIPSYLPQCVAFIDEARSAQRGVLVHCLAGISRSVTITVAYLMQHKQLTLDQAYDWVKRRKANIAPNFNFMGQLLDYERQLRVGSGSPDSGQFSSDEGESSAGASAAQQHPAVQADLAETGSHQHQSSQHGSNRRTPLPQIKLHQPPAGRRKRHLHTTTTTTADSTEKQLTKPEDSPNSTPKVTSNSSSLASPLCTPVAQPVSPCKKSCS